MKYYFLFTEFDGDDLTADMGDYFLPCPILPVVSHASMRVIRGSMEQLQAPPDTVVEYRCDNGYRIFSPPCEPAILRCKGGIWLGELPSCSTFHFGFEAPENL